MASSDPAPNVAASDAPLADELLWKAAVGRRSDYYLPRFAKYERQKRSFPSWHWPALFIAFWWALYRKAWGGAVLFFFLPILIGLLFAIGASLLPPEYSIAANVAHWMGILAAYVLPAMLANGVYYRRVKAWVHEARSRYPDSATQVAYLTGKGGTSGGVAVVAASALVAVPLIGIVAAIALPAYQDYVVRTKVATVMAAVEPLKQQIESHVSENNSLPREIDLGTFRGTQGAKYIDDIRFDNATGTITIVFGVIDSRLNGKSIEWVPSEAPGQPTNWVCRTVDRVPAQLLPAVCRH